MRETVLPSASELTASPQELAVYLTISVIVYVIRC